MVTLHGVEVQIGDKVWDVRYYWSEVISLYNRKMYEIKTNYNFYTTDGKHDIEDNFPTLFWNKVKIPKKAFIKKPKNVNKYQDYCIGLLG
jgi:hypothetical protein